MARLTRRQFVGTSLSAAGVGVAGVTGLTGTLGAAAITGAGKGTARGSSSDAPMIVYVDRGDTGQLHIMLDDRQVTVKDHEIVNRLMAATA